MSDCCSKSPSTLTAQDCPRCGASGKHVGMKTLYHQIRFPENQAIRPGDYYLMLRSSLQHCRQARRRRKSVVTNQVVCVKSCFFFFHLEMIRFLGGDRVTSDDNCPS